ncbi:TerC family protein [Labrys wisconsinensis]|uniref:Tellurium resistance membrane protein TerC n=1 Tax=Labrys wisconsinensis TaxID=425677 RepID=A0ABU0J5B0_9HYPH|nr:TerC family protein [Labrys wisconsinensis]MDQ0469451.1 putative tellurium resistance membrane protein TerC [Labrys wisconsinensis]
MIELLTDPGAWASLVTLTAMEIILGIDNIVFISVLVSKLPRAQAVRARSAGLLLALVFRILMLLALTWLIGLTDPVLSVLGQAVSWRDLILIAGGLFLLVKATHEIHKEFDEEEGVPADLSGRAFIAVILQVALIDIVFSVDSIVTAIGMAQHVPVMIAAVVIAMGVMWVSSGPIGGFIQRHPTTKMLALAFLMLIGVSLVADGVGMHIPRGYIYFAMAFAAVVETVNVLAKKRRARLKAQAKASGDPVRG